MADPAWRQAMQAEFNSLKENRTWKLVKRPPQRKVVQGKWDFRVKRSAEGEIIRNKARFVAKGYTQVEGLDYKETFAPTAKLSTFRVLLACAAHEGVIPRQMDIKTAYLHADIDEEIFLEQPEGFVEEGKEDHVCKLQKSLYGLKQSGRNWYQLLSRILEIVGFLRF